MGLPGPSPSVCTVRWQHGEAHLRCWEQAKYWATVGLGPGVIQEGAPGLPDIQRLSTGASVPAGGEEINLANDSCSHQLQRGQTSWGLKATSQCKVKYLELTLWVTEGGEASHALLHTSGLGIFPIVCDSTH